MERQKFEDQWKNAFSNAEAAPSENVWKGVELDLERNKGKRLKRRLIFYQLLAAASVAITLSIGLGVYFFKGDISGNRSISEITKEAVTNGNENVKRERQTLSEKPSDSYVDHLIEDNLPSERKSHKPKAVSESVSDQPSPAAIDDHSKTSRNIRSKGVMNNTYDGSSEESNFNALLAENENKTRHQEILSAFANPQLPPLIAVGRPTLNIQRSNEVGELDPVVVMLAKLDQKELQLRGKEDKEENEKNASEKLWTSVSVAAGSFQSANAAVAPTSTRTTFSMNRSSAEKEAQASGVAYSMGVNLGARLSERWVLQGGVNYLSQNSDYEANTAIGNADFSSFAPQSINELDKLGPSNDSERKLISTAPYNVNNDIRYLSIPVQAGYLLLNRDFAFQLNAGVSTDLFLQNTVTADGANISESTQRIGEDSPYRPVNFSGLFGTEISYRFAQRYRVALNPGLRYPFNSIYRSGVEVKASPLTLDVGLKFRYIFK